MSIEVNMSRQMRNSIENMMREVMENTISKCAEKYAFDKEEAKRMLGVSVVSVVKKVEKKEKKEIDSKIPLPFSGVVIEGCCRGLKQNHGLYTQCKNEKKGGEYCVKCEIESKKNESGLPDGGHVDDRMRAYVEGREYRDSKGRGVTAYVKVMKKLKLSKEEVEEEAKRCGVVIDEKEFDVDSKKKGRPKKVTALTEDSDNESKKRGRPKKEKKVVEVSRTEDLFATLITEARASSKEEDEISDMSDDVSEVSEVKVTSKEAKKGEKGAAKAEKKESKKAEKAAEKAAQREAEKAEKAAQKAAEKAAQKAEKKEAKKAEKKEAQKAEKKEATKEEKPVEKERPKEEEEEEVVTVKKFEFNGKKYLRTSANVLYDAETQDHVGVWNEAKQEIEECEEEEEEYEEED